MNYGDGEDEEFLGIVKVDEKSGFMFARPDGSTRICRIWSFEEFTKEDDGRVEKL